MPQPDASNQFIGSTQELRAMSLWLDEFTQASASPCVENGRETYLSDLRGLNKVLAVGSDYLGCLGPVEASKCQRLVGQLHRQVVTLLEDGLDGVLDMSKERERALAQSSRALEFAIPYFQRLGIRIRRELERRNEGPEEHQENVAALKQIDDSPRDGLKPPAKRKTKDEYNVEARAYLAVHPEAGPRELMEALGCGAGTVYKLSAFLAVREQREKGRKPKKPRTSTLTDEMAKLVEKGSDGELARLINEQKRDMATKKIHTKERS